MSGRATTRPSIEVLYFRIRAPRLLKLRASAPPPRAQAVATPSLRSNLAPLPVVLAPERHKMGRPYPWGWGIPLRPEIGSWVSRAA